MLIFGCIGGRGQLWKTRGGGARGKAERLVAEELNRARWKEKGLAEHPKSDPVKLALGGGVCGGKPP
jgi:hypothetical protein